jgi:C-terminal processing protease CtpA/Prc
MPPLPKNWPQQSPRTPTGLQVGPERAIIFLSDALGIKLNRGTDGVVRVMSVTPDTPGSPIVRTGYIEVGDVIREVAGVDIRRPITNIMWGDTVALVKMAPRPITVIVAREISPIPKTFHEERERIESHSVKSPAKRSAERGEEKAEI